MKSNDETSIDGVEAALQFAMDHFEGTVTFELGNMNDGVLGGWCRIYAGTSAVSPGFGIIGEAGSSTDNRLTLADAIMFATLNARII